MKILFIACYSPLINNSASIETLQYLNNLSKIQGNEIHLLTVNFPRNSVYYDNYIFNMLDKNIKLHIIPGGYFFEKVMPKKSVKIKNNTNYIKRKIMNLFKVIKRTLAIPDIYLYWAIKASKYAVKLCEKENFDVMFSMHEPPSSHICAYKIKKKFKEIKWVAYWSDPWVKDSSRENINFIRRRIESNLEKKIITATNKNVFVTKENRDDYIKTYNLKKENTFLITRGYDANLYEKIKKYNPPKLINKNKINMVYAGEIFSKLRDLNPFIESMNYLKINNKEIYNELNILFFGNIDDDNIKNKLNEFENITVSNRIAYNEALAYMLNSEVLVLFGNKNSKQIPAKIYDYFGCYGQILVILGDSNDPIYNLVKSIEKCVVVNNEYEDIVNAVKEILSRIDRREMFNPVKEYEWENISNSLYLILRGD